VRYLWPTRSWLVASRTASSSIRLGRGFIRVWRPRRTPTQGPGSRSCVLYRLMERQIRGLVPSHDARVLEVRIHLPPAGSQLRTLFGRRVTARVGQLRDGGAARANHSVKTAELLPAHRHHRQGAPPGTPEPGGVSPLLCRGVSSLYCAYKNCTPIRNLWNRHTCCAGYVSDGPDEQQRENTLFNLMLDRVTFDGQATVPA